MRPIKLILVALLVPILSCTSPTDENITLQERAEKLNQSDKIPENLKGIYFNMPAPEEIVGFLNDGDLPFIDSLLNPLQKDDELHSFSSQSLNLGMYLTDLAYILLFDQPNYTLKYFSKITNLSKELRISGVIEEERFDQVMQNMNNTAAMSEMFHEFYFKSIDYFMETEQHQTLSLIASGALIESLYLASNSFEDYKDSEAAFTRFAELKFVFENLMEYLGNFSTDPVVGPVYQQMGQLGEYLSKIEQAKEAKPSVSMVPSGIVLGNTSSLAIEQALFKEIKAKIEELRNQWALLTNTTTK